MEPPVPKKEVPLKEVAMQLYSLLRSCPSYACCCTRTKYTMLYSCTCPVIGSKTEDLRPSPCESSYDLNEMPWYWGGIDK